MKAGKVHRKNQLYNLTNIDNSLKETWEYISVLVEFNWVVAQIKKLYRSTIFYLQFKNPTSSKIWLFFCKCAADSLGSKTWPVLIWGYLFSLLTPLIENIPVFCWRIIKVFDYGDLPQILPGYLYYIKKSYLSYLSKI